MQQFWLLNLFFITLSLSALVYFIAGWLFWDSRHDDKNKNIYIRAIGFWILSIGSIASVFSEQYELARVVGVLGYLLAAVVLVYSIHKEQINPIPKFAVSPVLLYLPAATTLTFVLATVLLWRRYTKGLVKEYKLWVISFALLSLSQLLHLGAVFRTSNNVNLAEIGRIYGLTWTIAVLLQLASTAVLGAWVWSFLRFRIAPQLFSAFTAIATIVATTSAVIYSTLLFTAARTDFLEQIKTTVQTGLYNVNQLKASALTSANFLARSEAIRSLFSQNNLSELLKLVNSYKADATDIDYILVADASGSILIKTNDFSAVGVQTLSEDPVVVNAIKNKESRVTIVEQTDVLAKRLEVVSTAPVIGLDGSSIGVIQVGFVLDNAFVDRVKTQTGLDAAVYAGDKRAATTITTIDGKNRAENTVVADAGIKEAVLEQRQTYSGEDEILNIPYYTAYAPLVDVNSNTVGMISVGRPQILLMNTIEQAILNTFLTALAVSLFALLPIRSLSKYIYKNYRV